MKRLSAIFFRGEGDCLPWRRGEVVSGSWIIAAIETHSEFMRLLLRDGEQETAIEIIRRGTSPSGPGEAETRFYRVQPAPGAVHHPSLRPLMLAVSERLALLEKEGRSPFLREASPAEAYSRLGYPDPETGRPWALSLGAAAVLLGLHLLLNLDGRAAAACLAYFCASLWLGGAFPFCRYGMFAQRRGRTAALVCLARGEPVDIRDYRSFDRIDPDRLLPSGLRLASKFQAEFVRGWIREHAAFPGSPPGPVPFAIGCRLRSIDDGGQWREELRIVAEGTAWPKS